MTKTTMDIDSVEELSFSEAASTMGGADVTLDPMPTADLDGHLIGVPVIRLPHLPVPVRPFE